MGEVTAAETELAEVLETLVRRDLPRSQGHESRVDTYLALNELLRLEDSEASVQLFRVQLPALLREFRHDLQHATLPEVLHLCLRSLSYFMHHRGMVDVFPDEQVSFFLGEIIRLLYSTQEENFEAARHQFLPRTVEALVQAVVNPFKSRMIELQALKGLHLLLLKYPEQIARNAAVLSIWFKPVTSRLSSSRAETRTQARVLLQEASNHMSKWSESTLEMVRNCMQTYALPAMETHMDNERQKEALYLWQLTLSLLQARLASDLALLNSLLYVPEGCMRHGDAAVRLLSMEMWGGLVDVFHLSKEWLFKKPVVHLLVWPILVCLEDELLVNVVEAAFASWRKIVVVAVRDFNAFCEAQSRKIESAQQTLSPLWKRWLHEVVIKPVTTLVRVRLSRVDGEEEAVSPEVVQFLTFARSLWASEPPAVGDKAPTPNSESEGGHVSTAGLLSTLNEDAAGEALVDASNSSQMVLDMDDTIIQSVTSHSTPSAVGQEDFTSARIGSNVLVIAFLLPDVFDAVQKLSRIADEASRNAILIRDVAVETWSGVCARLHSSQERQDGPKNAKVADTLHLRLSRLCLDFAFGVFPPRTVITEAQSGNVDGAQTEQFLADSEDSVSVPSVSFGLRWQLRLLAAFVPGFKSFEGLSTLLRHPKSRSFENVTARMHHLKQTYRACVVVLDKWRETGQCRLNFSLKTSALACVAIVLVLEFAVDMDEDSTDDKANETRAVLALLQIVLDALVKAMKADKGQLSQGVTAVIRFTRASIDIARGCLEARANGDGGSDKMLDKLPGISVKSSKPSHVPLQNGLQLLEIQQSRQSSEIVPPSPSSPLNVPGAVHASVDDVAQDDSVVAASASISSRFSSRGEVSAKSPFKPPEPRSPSIQELQQTTSCSGTTEDMPMTPKRSTTPRSTDDAEGAGKKSSPAAGSRSAPPKLSLRSPSTSSQHVHAGSSHCIYAELVNCSEGISQLYRHFPLAFRPFFSFYKIKTVGDLSAMSVEKVKTFGMKDPVTTVRRALEEFSGRKSRMMSLQMSPYRYRAQQSPARSLPPGSTSSIASPSPRSTGKRPLHGQQRGVTSLSIESPQPKRSRRSLVFGDLGKKLDVVDEKRTEEHGATQQRPKVADRVTFCIPSGDAGATKIARPGEDVQEPLTRSTKPGEDKESTQDQMETYTAKMLQHLRRSAYYMDKLVAGESSLQANAATTVALHSSYQEARSLMEKFSKKVEVALGALSGEHQASEDKSGGLAPTTLK